MTMSDDPTPSGIAHLRQRLPFLPLGNKVSRPPTSPVQLTSAPITTTTSPTPSISHNPPSQRTTTSPISPATKKKKHPNDNDEEEPPAHKTTPIKTSLLSTLPQVTKLTTRLLLTTTVTLYILNQKHLLPLPLSRVVSKTLFWPTLPITALRRVGRWISDVDDVVVLGGAPFGFCNIPERLYNDYGARGVVNMCEEYTGPLKKYERLGVAELRLKTADHFEPRFEDLMSAVAFLRGYEERGERVYVHCRAGHGRSAAVTFAWLLYKNPNADPRRLNEELCEIRNVRKSLWAQPNLKRFHAWLKSGGRITSSGAADRRGGGGVDTAQGGEDYEHDEHVWSDYENEESSGGGMYREEDSYEDEKDYSL